MAECGVATISVLMPHRRLRPRAADPPRPWNTTHLSRLYRDEGSVMELDRRGCVVQPRSRANRRREEPMGKAKPFNIPKREVWEAFKRVKANQGAAGVDAQSIADFEGGLSSNLYKLWNRLSSGSYFPPPGAAGRYSEGRRWHAPVGHSDGRRPCRS